MNKKGFSKIETILIVSLTLLFLGISLINLKLASKNKKLDGQVKVMGADFESYRRICMMQKKRGALWIGPDEYVFKTYSSLGENISDAASGTVVAGRELRHEIAKIRGGVAYAFDIKKDRIEFDGRGLSSNIPGNRLDIVLWPVNLNTDENCIVIYPMRTAPGRMKDEKTCRPE
mgnify:CR=1 FL=1